MARKFLSGINTNTLQVTGGTPTTGYFLTSDASGNATWSTITLTTTGTSGAATLVSNTLNIPQYAGGGGGTTKAFAIAMAVAL